MTILSTPMKHRKSKLIKLNNRSFDKRGYITSIIDENTSNTSIILSKKNSIRSNHYHKKDFHYMYLISGEMHYFYKKINGRKLNYIFLKKGMVIFTPPNEIHTCFFSKDTKMLVSSKNPRDKRTYEMDTVRIEMLNIHQIKEYIKNIAK